MIDVLVSGAAGFIGFHTAKHFLEEGRPVAGIDHLNGYYDRDLKLARLELLRRYKNFFFERLDITDRHSMEKVFLQHRPTIVIHLAAQAGVRQSIAVPHIYIDSNITGFLNILEGCRQSGVTHLVYASSSSVYGATQKIPFSVSDTVDRPVSLYAATKKANELMAHAYSHLFGIPTTGLRFFSVYGPWGRPDMAPLLFAQAITAGTPIKVFNYGRMKRDFTYIDDIVGAVALIAERPPADSPPYKIYNVGSEEPTDLLRFIEILEEHLGQRTDKVFLPMQPGDVPETFADMHDLAEDFGFKPATPIGTGVARFVDWYRGYYANSISMPNVCTQDFLSPVHVGSR